MFSDVIDEIVTSPFGITGDVVMQIVFGRAQLKIFGIDINDRVLADRDEF